MTKIPLIRKKSGDKPTAAVVGLGLALPWATRLLFFFFSRISWGIFVLLKNLKGIFVFLLDKRGTLQIFGSLGGTLMQSLIQGHIAN
jgi:hypothetical protein